MKYRYIIAFFAISAILSYLLLSELSIQPYITLMFALFTVQLSLNYVLEKYLGSELRNKYFNMIIAPGTVIHEASHALVAKMLGCEITNISFFSAKNSGVLGFVEYTQPADRVKGVRSLLISFAPFFGCGVFLIAILNFLALNYPGMEQIGPGLVEVGSLNQFINTLEQIIARLYGQLLYLDLTNPALLIVLYLEFSFALGSAPSLQDIAGASKSILEYRLEALSMALLVVSVLLIIEYGPILDPSFSTLSEAALLSMKWFTLVLMISTIMLFASVPLSYIFVETAEIKGPLKIVPLVVFFIVYVFLAKFLAVGAVVTVATSVGAYLLSLLLIKKPEYFIREA